MIFLAILPILFWCLIGRSRMGRMKDTGGWVQFIPLAISLASSLLNKKKAPATAEPTPVNLADEQNRAIQGNLSQEGNIEKLLGQANKFAQGQANDVMEQAVPGYGAFSQKLLQSGQDKLNDPYGVPEEVTTNLNRISAERGISRGTAGQTNQYSALRDLGVNMLDYGSRNFQQAIQALTTVTGIAPRISPMSPMSFYVTPAQNAQVAAGNNANQQAVAQGANNAAAAAGNANNQNLWDSLASAAGSFAGSSGSGSGTTDPTAGNIGTD